MLEISHKGRKTEEQQGDKMSFSMIMFFFLNVCLFVQNEVRLKLNKMVRESKERGVCC